MVEIFKKLRETMKMNETTEPVVEPTVEKEEEKRVNGKVIKVSSDGYGFISSKEIPFTRIFFHWTSLRPDTLNFKDLRAGMNVSFVAFNVEDKGCRAIKIKVEE